VDSINDLLGTEFEAYLHSQDSEYEAEPRTATFDPSQPRDKEGQWTSGGIVYHGSPRENLESILKHGIAAYEDKSTRKSHAGITGKVAYVSTSLTEAQAFAMDRPETYHGIVVEIHVPPGEPFKTSPTSSTILARDQAIPASWIKAVYGRVNSKGQFQPPMTKAERARARVTGKYVKTSWQKIRALTTVEAQTVFVVVFLGGDEIHVASRHMEGPVHAAADAHLDKMLVAIQYAFAKGRQAVPRTGTPSARRVAMAVRLALLKVLPGVLQEVLVAGGVAGLAGLVGSLRGAAMEPRTAKAPPTIKRTVSPFKMSFDAHDPRAVTWAKDHAAELADNLSATTEQDIRDAVARAVEFGELDTLYEDVLDAVGNDARAGLIARTEVMTAANEGQRIGWDQAVDEGLLSGDETREWIATGDEGVCPICEALNGEHADLHGEYPAPGGEGPPAHPNCRCTEGIIG
jgi:SPP1 gp7 family putative phage head morphogenesis protein